MNKDRAKRKLSAILSADVQGYSRLMGENELATIETLKKYRELIFSLIQQFRGRVIDSPGDNLLAEFGSVVDAVECTARIQEEVKKKNEEVPESRRMEFRIGVNLGDVVEDGERIYGDGVNIAARIQSLAVGGGVCISRTAYDQVRNKMSAGYEYLGEHSVKNIKDPVGVYRLVMDAEARGSIAYRYRRDDPGHRRRATITAIAITVASVAAVSVWYLFLRGPSNEPASPERMAFALPDKPSIAVLPFTNMSGDPEQDYIGDGLSENLISALAVSSKLFVIARNSTFAYKGSQVKVQTVAEDLGVQYVLEGSIQKSGDRLRVTAQLIDALTGHHLWTEVYDREMKELFELQDEITKKIVVSLQVELTFGESFRMYAKSTDDLEAWIHYVKAAELCEKVTRENNIEAREHLEAALKLDPEFVNALTFLSFIHGLDASLGFSDSPFVSLGLAYDLVQKAITMDETNSFAHSTLGDIYLTQREHEKAIAEGRRAIALNPNYAGGYGTLAKALHFSGRFEESVSIMERAFRLDPRITPTFLIYLCKSYIFLGRYKEALDVCNQMDQEASRGNLAIWIPPALFANVYQELGREAEARASVREALELRPDFSLDFFRTSDPYRDPAHLQRVLDAYRNAGLPEKAPGGVK